MQKLFKQFEESVTRWKANIKTDEFFTARLRLTFYYSITAIVILGGSSIVLYNTILSNLAQSLSQNIFLSPNVGAAILDRAQDILLNRFLTIDITIIFFIVILGFFLTRKTLAPINANVKKQKRFIADASHELRTPIAVIISGLEVNLENKKLDLAGAKKTLESSLEEMREFSKLSNDLLDLSKYDTRAQTKQNLFLIDKLLNNIVEKNKNLAKLKEINIETTIEGEANVLGNKIELSRVFYNILDNAIKYTGSRGKISISGKINLNKYLITISDNGVGISKDVIGKIFDPFFQGDTSRNTKGAGLGLTLSKKIIENHKGTISIKSQENKGTEVVITLPLSS